jgi:hypothetical protein
MSEEKKKKPRGFAGVIYSQLMPLNEKEEFQQKYKDSSIKLLLNATDGRYAAFITIDNGIINVEGIPNKEKEDLKKDVLGWDGKLEMTTNLFLDFGMGKISTSSFLVKWLITRKIKMKSMKNVMTLIDLFAILDEKTEEPS